MFGVVGGSAARADGLRVLAAGSALHGLCPAAAPFTRESGIAVAVATDHGHSIRTHALAGQAAADVVLVPTEWAEEIAAAGRADRSTMLAIGAVGAAVKAGAPHPDISSMEALRRTLVSADAVLLTLAPTGDQLMKVIERFGLAATAAPKLQRFGTATQFNRHLAENGTLDTIGFGPATEIIVWRGKGVGWGGPVPDESRSCCPTPPQCSRARAPSLPGSF